MLPAVLPVEVQRLWRQKAMAGIVDADRWLVLQSDYQLHAKLRALGKVQ